MSAASGASGVRAMGCPDQGEVDAGGGCWGPSVDLLEQPRTARSTEPLGPSAVKGAPAAPGPRSWSTTRSGCHRDCRFLPSWSSPGRVSRRVPRRVGARGAGRRRARCRRRPAARSRRTPQRRRRMCEDCVRRADRPGEEPHAADRGRLDDDQPRAGHRAAGVGAQPGAQPGAQRLPGVGAWRLLRRAGQLGCSRSDPRPRAQRLPCAGQHPRKRRSPTVWRRSRRSRMAAAEQRPTPLRSTCPAAVGTARCCSPRGRWCSHRVPMDAFPNQVPAFDAVRISVAAS